MSRSPTLASRDQVERQLQARRLLRQAGDRVRVTRDGRVAVTDAALARELMAVKAEAVELLTGLRCLHCLELLGVQARVPAPGLGWVHEWSCAGPARRPRASA